MDVCTKWYNKNEYIEHFQVNGYFLPFDLYEKKSDIWHTCFVYYVLVIYLWKIRVGAKHVDHKISMLFIFFERTIKRVIKYAWFPTTHNTRAHDRPDILWFWQIFFFTVRFTASKCIITIYQKQQTIMLSNSEQWTLYLEDLKQKYQIS